MGHVTLVAINWMTIMVHHHAASRCNSFEDQAPVDEIYNCSIFKCVDLKIRPQDNSLSNDPQGNMPY